MEGSGKLQVFVTSCYIVLNGTRRAELSRQRTVYPSAAIPNLWHARAVPGVHETFAFVTLGANVIAAAWGAFVWSRGIISRAFWWLLRVAQATVVVQVILGLVLLAEG